MKYKKLITAVLSFSMLLSLSACKPQNNTEEIKNEQNAAEKENFFKNEFTLFEKNNKNIVFLDKNNKLYAFDIPTSINAENLTVGENFIVSTENDIDTSKIKQDIYIKNIGISDNNKPLSNIFEIKDNMTLEEKVGQLFYVRCPLENAEAHISKYNLGGYILFANNFKDKTKESTIDEINNFQNKSSIPMLIGVDEEGGIVNRISKFKNFRDTPFLSPQELYTKGGFEIIKSDTEEKCSFLKSLGINVNMAPVCDISENPNDFIYERSFGKNADETSKYVKTVVSAMKSENMGSVLKHFPGYGGNADTHTGIAVDEKSKEEYFNSDLIPFMSGINEGSDIVLVSHNIVKCFDENNPASLSPEIHRLLREDLNFYGAIMTDDLVMEGVKNIAGIEGSAVAAINAGNDLLCATDYEAQIPAVINAVNNGTITEETLNSALLRVLYLKSKLGILK